MPSEFNVGSNWRVTELVYNHLRQAYLEGRFPMTAASAARISATLLVVDAFRVPHDDSDLYKGVVEGV